MTNENESKAREFTLKRWHVLIKDLRYSASNDVHCPSREIVFADVYDALQKENEELKANCDALFDKIKKHYYCYGYEKQNYLKEMLEEHFKCKFPVGGIDNE